VKVIARLIVAVSIEKERNPLAAEPIKMFSTAFSKLKRGTEE
jgi:hypothetical protein